MFEKRRSKRLPISLKLNISDLFKQDNKHVSYIEAPIEVIDISRVGIGFQTESVLPMGYYFNANIQLGSENESLYAVVKIVRSQLLENGFTVYGCEFIGLAPVLSYIFDDYEKKFEDEDIQE